MSALEIIYHPIGTIHSPFVEIAGMPIQPSGAAGVRGRIEVLPQYVAGLRDLDGFSHIIMLYHFHRVREARLQVTPFLDSEPRGLFATRAPKRPNPIGLSVVKLMSIQGNVLHVENVDVLDGTPLLDLKPYVPEFDVHPADRTGWLQHIQGEARNRRSDERFR